MAGPLLIVLVCKIKTTTESYIDIFISPSDSVILPPLRGMYYARLSNDVSTGVDVTSSYSVYGVGVLYSVTHPHTWPHNTHSGGGSDGTDDIQL